MMLEQSLISPNFLGKESFRWFIGVVTQYVQVQDSNIGGGYKAKVRIVGYHPASQNGIKDDELPWAHVLVPLTMGTGTGGMTTYNIPQGGETVIGFFMDGDNGQQPVIIGGLFSGADILHPNTFTQGTENFSPFQRRTAPFNIANIDAETKKSKDPKTKATITPGPDGQAKNSEGKEKPTVANGVTENNTTITIPPQCKESKTTYSRILKSLRDFVRVLRTVQQVTGFISDIPSLLQTALQDTTNALTDSFSTWIKYTRNLVMDVIHEWWERQMIKFQRAYPKTYKFISELGKEKVIDGIWCAFRKVLSGLKNFITTFLETIIDKVINFPFCAVEALVGSVMSAISNQIQETAGAALQEASNLIGGPLGEISSYVSKALQYTTSAVQFLSCESAECKQAHDYEMNKGYIKDSFFEDVNKALGAPTKGIRDAAKAAEDFNATHGSDSNCDVTSLECGLPTVSFFGGGGFGAAGLAVVDAIGQVAGINITDFGVGYTSPPYVSIDDPCGNGSGAQATAVIDSNGQVSQVSMDSPGWGYLNPGTEGIDPCNVNPIDESGSEVVGFIVGVKIIRPGIDYTAQDLITNIRCDSDVEIYPQVDSLGRIIGATIVNPGTAIRVFPELFINTENGEGAILQPILSFKPIEKVGVETTRSKVKQVVLCAEEHGL